LSNISKCEEADFHYLLALLPAITNVPEYSALPELFSIIGHESLITLCKYAGGETIKIPTLEELYDSIIALNWYHNVYISGSNTAADIPEQYQTLVSKIVEKARVE